MNVLIMSGNVAANDAYQQSGVEPLTVNESGDWDQKPAVSVVVVTRNRPEMLGRCLQHLQKQHGASFEIIVVDGSSDDQTRQVAQNYPIVTYLFLADGKNKMAQARNVGLAASRGNIVAFVDDDSMVQSGWLSTLVNKYTRPEIGGVGGLVLDEHETSVETPAGEAVVGRVFPDGQLVDNFALHADRPLEVDRLRGCNMSFRRSVLEEIGGFDPAFDAAAYSVFEEVDVCTRIRRAGFILIFEPQAAVHHLNAPREDGLPRRVDGRQRMYAYARNRTYFVLRNFGWKGAHLSKLFWFDTVHYLYLWVKKPAAQKFGVFVGNVAGKVAGVMAAARRVSR